MLSGPIFISLSTARYADNWGMLIMRSQSGGVFPPDAKWRNLETSTDISLACWSVKDTKVSDRVRV